MKKFIITGSMRSGTTYFASILNSQVNTFCLEDYPWRTFPNQFQSVEELLTFSNNLDARFVSLGLPRPKLAEHLMEGDDTINLYIEHLKQIYACENIGFKRTMMTNQEIHDRVEDGFKIIIMKRDIKQILKSYVHRIDADINKAASHIQNWLKDINYYNIESNSVMVLDYDELINSYQNTINRVSKFLELKIEDVGTRYHSFNKGRYTFSSNTSFISNDNNKLLSRLPTKYSDDDYEKVSQLVEQGIFKLKIRKGNKIRKIIKKIAAKVV